MTIPPHLVWDMTDLLPGDVLLLHGPRAAIVAKKIGQRPDWHYAARWDGAHPGPRGLKIVSTHVGHLNASIYVDRTKHRVVVRSVVDNGPDGAWDVARAATGAE